MCSCLFPLNLFDTSGSAAVKLQATYPVKAGIQEPPWLIPCSTCWPGLRSHQGRGTKQQQNVTRQPLLITLLSEISEFWKRIGRGSSLTPRGREMLVLCRISVSAWQCNHCLSTLYLILQEVWYPRRCPIFNVGCMACTAVTFFASGLPWFALRPMPISSFNFLVFQCLTLIQNSWRIAKKNDIH